jgi:hypothetical protein
MMSASLDYDMWSHLKKGGHKPNVKALKNAVARLTLAAMQKTGGQRPDDTPDKTVNFKSPEIAMAQYVILCEAVALVLSGALDELEKGQAQ